MKRVSFLCAARAYVVNCFHPRTGGGDGFLFELGTLPAIPTTSCVPEHSVGMGHLRSMPSANGARTPVFLPPEANV